MSFRWFQKRPTGCRAPDALEQWIIDHLQSLQPQNSPTVTISHRDSKGFQMRAAPAGQGGGTSLIQCVVTQCFGQPAVPIDYIGVTAFNLQTMALSGAQFNCAKCVAARQPSAETIDGQAITYAQYNAAGQLPANNADNVRQASFNVGETEWQVVHRRYLPYPGNVQAGYDIGQFLINVSSIQNGVGMTDLNGKTIQYEEVSWREWAYSPYLNGGND